PGQRLYRSGDLARWRPDGQLEFLGRTDHQLNLRGIRTEPAEIETALLEHPAITGAAVVARQHAATDERLVAYVTADGGGAPSPAELRAHLAERLPTPLIPAAFVALERLPLSAHGKLDRSALPEPDAGALAAGGYVAPRDPMEGALADLWAQVLNVERAGVHDDFFALGGHSLLAIQLVARVRQRFGVPLSLHVLFESPTIAGLAAEIMRARLEELDEASLAALVQEVDQSPALTDHAARDER
ncbi:MAG TPA: phosphopantetheine-binding protein, partial [Solirubrobacteraceae bacterium]|nr:phosphopantetheine-binding protein [Solirubrobacteraceae bacterium]